MESYLRLCGGVRLPNPRNSHEDQRSTREPRGSHGVGLSAQPGGQRMVLAMVHGIARGHVGLVWHEPVTPHGARFVLKLPIAVNS
jgi:hypothetical protein